SRPAYDSPVGWATRACERLPTAWARRCHGGQARAALALPTLPQRARWAGASCARFAHPTGSPDRYTWKVQYWTKCDTDHESMYERSRGMGTEDGKWLPP